MKPLLIGVFLIFTSVVYADNNNSVTQWSNQALMRAFSVDFNYNEQHSAAQQKWFTPMAWESVNGFLEAYLSKINENKLTVHPEFLIAPRVVDSGEASGISFWRVNSEMAFPELQLKVFFSMIVLKTNTTGGNSFIIQSLNMTKQDQP